MKKTFKKNNNGYETLDGAEKLIISEVSEKGKSVFYRVDISTNIGSFSSRFKDKKSAENFIFDSIRDQNIILEKNKVNAVDEKPKNISDESNLLPENPEKKASNKKVKPAVKI